MPPVPVTGRKKAPAAPTELGLRRGADLRKNARGGGLRKTKTKNELAPESGRGDDDDLRSLAGVLL